MKVSVAYVSANISKLLRKVLAWVIDKLLWVISNIMLSKAFSYTTKELKNEVINLKILLDA